MMKRPVAALIGLALVLGCTLPAAAYTQEEQQELQIGQQVRQQLHGEILTSSPYYSTLDSIASRIKSVADQKYFVPFHFVLVHETQPNAFSVPGGDVYVTDSMMKFVQNKEELAGVLCHETSHAIHHDVMNNYVKDQQLSMYAGLASLIFGGGRSQVANAIIQNLAGLKSLTFSRDVEHNADHTGAYICAQAGINPYGMIWLFDKFEQNPSGAPPEALSDHPRDDHRISDLETEFKADPATFGKFNPDIASATPIGTSTWRNPYIGAASATTARRQASKHTTNSAWKFNPRSNCC